LLDIRWAPLARDDLTEVDRHYAAIDFHLANEIVARIVTAAIFLRDTPLAGPATGQGTRRKWRMRGIPYILFYRATADQLRILRVLHSARDRHTS